MCQRGALIFIYLSAEPEMLLVLPAVTEVAVGVPGVLKWDRGGWRSPPAAEVWHLSGLWTANLFPRDHEAM